MISPDTPLCKYALFSRLLQEVLVRKPASRILLAANFGVNSHVFECVNEHTSNSRCGMVVSRQPWISAASVDADWTD